MGAARAVAVVGLVGYVGCVAGSPPGYSAGNTWSVPIVNPLETDLVVVPVKINGGGPFLFAVDPEAESTLDQAVANRLRVHTVISRWGQRRRDGRSGRRLLAEVNAVTVGSLTIRNRVFVIHDPGAYVVGGRAVHGVLGREVLSDTLLVSVDRDRGVVTIATQGHLTAPASANGLDYTKEGAGFVLGIVIDGRRFRAHPAPASRHTRLPKTLIDRWRWEWVKGAWRMTNRGGEVWYASAAAVAPVIRLGPTDVSRVAVVPFERPHRSQEDLPAALGQDVLSRVNLLTDWHHKRLWVWPRRDAVATAADRLARWGKVFDGCPTPACVTARVDSGRLVVERDPSATNLEYEVVLQPVDAAGKTLTGAPRAQATLPRGQAVVFDPAPDAPWLAAAGFVVVDASPFVRACDRNDDGTSRCVWPAP